MRILYFADVRFPLERANGIQTMETCHALAARGHDVDLIVRGDTHVPARDPFAYYGLPRVERLRIERVGVAGPAAMRRFEYLALAARRATGATSVDVIVTRDLGVASLLLRLPRALRAALVYESHGYAPEVAAALPALVSTGTPPAARKIRRLTRREAYVWRHAEGYITITAGLASALATRHGARPNLVVIPDGAHLRPADRVADVNAVEPPVVAYAGHLYAWKGVDVLLDALALVPDARGLIVGGHGEEPDLGRLRQRAADLGISERVTFTGLVEPGRVADLLRQATVLVLPNPASAISTRFTSPLKLFEYMATGRPIVASDLPAIREILHDEVDALLVPPGDASALARGLRRLLDDPALASRLGRASLDAVPQYSWERRGERIEALLSQLTADR